MLFRKKIDPSCSYCVYGNQISERDVACGKKGIMAVEDSCRKFRYDPTKRVPPRPATIQTTGLSREDFTL